MANDLINEKSDIKFAKLLFNKGTDDALSFNCLIKNVEKDFVNFVGMSDYSDQVKVGSPLDVKIYSSNGVVSAGATLLKVAKKDNTPIYTTSYPKPYDHTQKRAYYRADMHLPVTVMIVLPNAKTHLINTTTKNVSGRGMCFISLEPEIPEYFSITVNLKFKDRYVVTTADHIYTSKVAYKNKFLYIHAFKFIGISVDDINFVIKECFLYQINKKKRI